MRHLNKSILAAPTILAATLIANPATAVQFSYLDPGYTQEIYAGPLTPGQEAGMAWTVGGNLLTRAGSSIIEYNLTQNATYNGTTLHGSIATHAITGLNYSGYGMTNGTDGYIYAITGSGLQRFNPGNWAAPAQNMTSVVSPGWGITTLSNGNIAYAGGWGSTDIYVYDPINLTNNLIYTASTLIDDMAASSTGEIVLAGHGNSSLIVISNTGTLINTVSSLAHYPDGLTFGDGSPTNLSIFSNNNDGTISQFQFGGSYANTPTISTIASGSGAYGDLAAVGPDCAFYVSQYENGGSNGSTAGVGTNWDNNTTTSHASIVRIAAAPRPDGTPATCGFRTPVLTTVSTVVPVPGSWFLMGSGLVALFYRGRKKAVHA